MEEETEETAPEETTGGTPAEEEPMEVAEIPGNMTLKDSTSLPSTWIL